MTSVLPMMVPPQGTPEFDAFMEKALRDPKSPEAIVLDAAMASAKQAYQKKVQDMLKQMQELVPGQLFRDVSLFHQKYKLEPTNDPGHKLDPELLKFRFKFMLEELQEYADSVGLTGDWNSGEVQVAEDSFDPELALDSLIDLIYVALGTAYMHRFMNFNEGWRRVQEANMKKERVARVSDSKRGSTYDVVKPPGWTPPSHKDLLGARCCRCMNNSLTQHGGTKCEVVLPSGDVCGGLLE